MKPYYKYKKLNSKIEKDLQYILDYVVNEIGINVTVKCRNRLYPEYRSLINTIAFRKYILSPSEMCRFWAKNGLKIKHDNILYSVSKFDVYSSGLPELNYYLNKFFPEATEVKEKKVELIDNKNLSELQNLVAKIPKYRQDEIKELVELRIKSWSWKSKDNVKVYEGGTNISKMVY